MSFRIAQDMALDIVQPVKIPHLRNVYKKLDLDNRPGAENLAGFGLEHEGVKAGIAQAHTGPRFESIQDNETVISNLTAFLLCFDTGTPTAVGRDLTITKENLASAAVVDEWDTLEQQVRGRRIDLIARADFGGLLHSGEYHSDAQPDLTRNRACP
jgi:hypothetical protein